MLQIMSAALTRVRCVRRRPVAAKSASEEWGEPFLNTAKSRGVDPKFPGGVGFRSNRLHILAFFGGHRCVATGDGHVDRQPEQGNRNHPFSPDGADYGSCRRRLDHVTAAIATLEESIRDSP